MNKFKNKVERMKNSIVATSLLSLSTALIIGLTGCGGDSDGSGSEASVPTPITAYDFEQSSDAFVVKAGADGDLSFDNGTPSFVNGASSIEIKAISNTTVVNYTDSNGVKTKGTFTSNASDGKATLKHVVESSPYGSTNCTQTYDIAFLPVAITDSEEIMNYAFLENLDSPTESDCPEWIDSEEDVAEPVSGFTQSNITFTDVSDKKHNIATYNGLLTPSGTDASAPSPGAPTSPSGINTSKLATAYQVQIMSLNAASCSASADASQSASVGVTVEDTYSAASLSCSDLGLSSSKCTGSGTCILGFYPN